MRLGFSNDAAQAITGDQGIDSIDELKVLSDAEVENLCKVVRRPGGTVPNPADAANPLPNNGHQVSLRAENNLKLACYYVRHRNRINRPTDAAGITLNNVRGLRHLRDTEINHEDPEEAPKIDASNWPKTLKALEEYIRGFLGTTDVPLLHVTREEQDVPDAAANLAAGQPNSPYESVQAEMIARAPHLTTGANPHPTPEYLTDWERVWDLIASVARAHECWDSCQACAVHKRRSYGIS